MLARPGARGLWGAVLPSSGVSSTLAAVYDGKRRGDRIYVLLLPFSEWGEKAFGLERPKDDFVLRPSSPAKGDKIDVVVSPQTYRRLQFQRALRARKRGAKR